MSVGEQILRESTLRLRPLRRGYRVAKFLLYWGAVLNYLLSVIVLAAGLTAGWTFAEIGFDLMLQNKSGEEVTKKIIKKIPAWLLVYKKLDK